MRGAGGRGPGGYGDRRGVLGVGAVLAEHPLGERAEDGEGDGPARHREEGAAPRWRTPKPATATETGKVPMTASMTRLMTRPMSAEGAQTWSIVTTTMFCQPLARA